MKLTDCRNYFPFMLAYNMLLNNILIERESETEYLNILNEKGYIPMKNSHLKYKITYFRLIATCNGIINQRCPPSKSPHEQYAATILSLQPIIFRYEFSVVSTLHISLTSILNTQFGRIQRPAYRKEPSFRCSHGTNTCQIT